jgi:hypothetical protein
MYLYTNDYDATKLPPIFTAPCAPWEEYTFKHTTTSGRRQIDKLNLIKPMTTHVFVYKCADMLGIAHLKQEAASRFLHLAETAYELDGFEEPLATMFDNTPTSDKELRLPVINMCLENPYALRPRQPTVRVLNEAMGGTWEVVTLLLGSQGGGRVQAAMEATVAGMLDTIKQQDLRCKHMKPVKLDLRGSSKAAAVRVVKVATTCKYCKAQVGK